MATEEIRDISYVEAVLLHIELMRLLGEIRYGVFDRALVESSLARPIQAADYENADLLRQAATLCYGLIKNHPWVGGNKRTATALLERGEACSPINSEGGVTICNSLLLIHRSLLPGQRENWRLQT